MLKEGIYEKLINKELSTELKVSKLDIGKEEVDKAEASKNVSFDYTLIKII